VVVVFIMVVLKFIPADYAAVQWNLAPAVSFFIILVGLVGAKIWNKIQDIQAPPYYFRRKTQPPPARKQAEGEKESD